MVYVININNDISWWEPNADDDADEEKAEETVREAKELKPKKCVLLGQTALGGHKIPCIYKELILF